MKLPGQYTKKCTKGMRGERALLTFPSAAKYAADSTDQAKGYTAAGEPVFLADGWQSSATALHHAREHDFQSICGNAKFKHNPQKPFSIQSPGSPPVLFPRREAPESEKTPEDYRNATFPPAPCVPPPDICQHTLHGKESHAVTAIFSN